MNTGAGLTNAVIVQAPRTDLRATPGQYFLVVPPTFDPYLPRAVYPFRLRGEFVESLIVPREVEAWMQQGVLKIRGAYGKGFSLVPNGPHVLVLAADAAAGAHLIPLLDSLIKRECEVAALSGPEAMEESWLPPEVEYHIVEDVLAAASDLLNWADAMFACGPANFYDMLQTSVKNTRLHLEPGWAQILMHEIPTPCGTGICYACAFKLRRGVVLNCQDGPVFDLADWVSEG